MMQIIVWQVPFPLINTMELSVINDTSEEQIGAGGNAMVFSLNNSSRIEFFDRFEDRETAFNEAVGCLVPVMYKGPNVFWRNFQSIIKSTSGPNRELPAFITSNPRDCLAFGSPAQVL